MHLGHRSEDWRTPETPSCAGWDTWMEQWLHTACLTQIQLEQLHWGGHIVNQYLNSHSGGKFSNEAEWGFIHRPTTGELTINDQFVFLLFYGQTDREGEGFKLNIRDAGSSYSAKSVTFQREETSFSLRYPLHGSRSYSDHQAFFMLGAPSLGMSANVTVSNVQTEGCCDFVFLFWINPTGLNTTTCER